MFKAKYKGTFKLVAIKIIDCKRAAAGYTDTLFEDSQEEIKKLLNLKHPNIVQLDSISTIPTDLLEGEIAII